jgi:hypothetical protein
VKAILVVVCKGGEAKRQKLPLTGMAVLSCLLRAGQDNEKENAKLERW